MMDTKANKRKTLLVSNTENVVDVQSKKKNLLSCDGIPQLYSFVNFCKNNTTLHNEMTKMTFSAKTGKKLLIY